MGGLRPKYVVKNQRPVKERLKTRIQELRGPWKECSNNPQRALDALNRQLDYLTRKHTIREAKSIKILTILATLYFTLSLSAALLGMQTPSKAVVHTATSNWVSRRGTNLSIFVYVLIALLCAARGFEGDGLARLPRDRDNHVDLQNIFMSYAIQKAKMHKVDGVDVWEAWSQ